MPISSTSRATGKILILVLSAMGRLPLGLRQQLGDALGVIFSLIPTKDRMVADLQLAMFLPPENRPPVRRVYQSIGRSILESFNLSPLLPPNSGYIECSSLPIIEQIKAERRPTIALTAHLGNWDLLAAYICSLGVKVFTFGRRARISAFQVLLEWLRGRYGIETIWRGKFTGGLRRAIELLDEGKVLAALIDQDTRVRSAAVPFFGTPAATPLGLIELGQSRNAVFVSAFIVRHNGKYKVIVETLDGQAKPAEILREFNRRLETLIREHPEQWVWFHKRWRTVYTDGNDYADGNVKESKPRRLGGKEYIEYLRGKLAKSA